METMFISAGIFDRYLALLGHWNFPVKQVSYLAVVSLLIAAKLEQPKHPNFQNMIMAFEDLNGERLDPKELLDLEEKILVQLGFDFNFTGPLHTVSYTHLRAHETVLDIV